MGKIGNKLADLIKTAMKEKKANELKAYRNVKAKFIEFKTSNEGIKKLINGEMTDADEINTINKMIKERNKDIETYATRQDLIDEANVEISILETLVPKAASEVEIKDIINKWLSENNVDSIEKKQMGQLITYVKSALPSADGRMTSQIVMSYIH